MKAIKILLILVVIVVILVGGALFALNRYLQSPALKETALAAARSALGSEVTVNELTISLFSGVSLTGIAVANPSGFDGNLLQARAFTLRYRLWPLLRKQVEITKLTLDEPAIHLARNQAKVWNYEALTAGDKPADPAAPTAPAGKQMAGLDVSLNEIALVNGSIDMRAEDGKLLLAIENLNLTSAVTMTGGRLGGTGKATIETLNLADALFIRGVSSPVAISSAAVKLEPLSGRLADGAVSGSLILELTGDSQYRLNLQVTDGDVVKLLQEAGSKPVLSGRLQLAMQVAGTGGLPTITGNGRAEIADGQVMEIPLLKLLGTLLQIPELVELKFTECLLEFTIADNLMQTPVIRVIAPKIQISGNGTVALDDYSLNHTLTLAVESSLLERVPKEIRAAFTAREDGYLALEFKVTGPYDSPKTDLTQRLLRGATDQLLQRGLKQLLK